MNGNRGAKGSIKDRLISMLYRDRYKKAVSKNEYKVDKKERQLNYLNNLKEFKDNEDINVLSKEDLNKLSKVKYTANFKVTKKGNDVDVTLSSIESKNSNLTEPTNIKAEIKKVKNEVQILKEVSCFIKSSLNDISSIKDDIYQIKKEAYDKNKDFNELEERYKKLRQKVDKLKLQYDSVKDKYDLSDLKIIENIKLINSINDYKDVATLNEMETLLDVCKDEIEEINEITVVNERANKAGIEIDEVKRKQDNIKIKFKKSKEKEAEIDKLKTNIISELKYQQEIINDLYSKASYLNKTVTKQIVYVRRKSILGSLLRMAGGVVTLPLTGKSLFGVALGQTMINKSLKELNKPLKKKEVEVVDYEYEDISSKLNNVSDKLEYTKEVIEDSLYEIKKLKISFKDEYKKFSNILSDYSDTLEKIESLEKTLKFQHTKIKGLNNTVEKEKEMNKQKLKKIKY